MDQNEIKSIIASLQQRGDKIQLAIKGLQALLDMKEVIPHGTPTSEQFIPDAPRKKSSVVGFVRSLFIEHPNQEWTVSQIVDAIIKEGIQTQSKNLSVTAHTALRAIKRKNEIRITKPGEGRKPNIYIYAGKVNTQDHPCHDKQLPFKSFRQSILDILKGHPEGLRPKSVTKMLKDNGFTQTGKTAFVTKVSNTLFAMNKSGKVIKDENGLYRFNVDNHGA